MAPHRLTAEYTARLAAGGVLLGLLLAGGSAWGLKVFAPGIELHARLAEAGGWSPAALSAPVGQPLRLRLTSDDVMHGFAIGQSELPALDIWPGQVVETTLTFDRPGVYTFYCTRWCGLGHWRMRGTIEVTGAASTAPGNPPLYVALGIDLDAPRSISNPPALKPSAARGAQLNVTLPQQYSDTAYYRAHTPAEVWQALRAEYRATAPADQELWDLVAFISQLNTTPEQLATGRQLYAANCAVCHGETGVGDGVAARALAAKEQPALAEFGSALQAPVNFTDSQRMLGASPALLQGKIVRGGMGTGMPYWGPLLTEAQTWALTAYLWTFQFDYLQP